MERTVAKRTKNCADTFLSGVFPFHLPHFSPLHFRLSSGLQSAMSLCPKQIIRVTNN